MARPAFGSDGSAVTPVVGTLLIMGITVAGIVGILYWGTPTIQAIQDQNALVAMNGEFQDLRLGTLELTIPDASRVPRIPVGDGELGLEPGTRVVVHVVHADTDCDFHVTGWEGGAVTDLSVAYSGCGTDPDINVYKVTGSNVLLKATVTPAASPQAVTVTGEDVTTGDWEVEVVDVSGTVAEAWIVGSDAVVWSLDSSVSDIRLVLEAGAIFEQDGDTVFLLEDPPLREDAFTTGDHVFRLPAFKAASYDSVSGRSTTTVFIGLLGHHLRTTSEDVVQVRYDFHGGLAEAWCNALLLRHPADGTYSEYGSYTCDGSDASGIRSVTYERTGQALFPFEFFHDRIHVFLQT